MILRSLLFAPGNVPRRVEKAITLDADAVIIDLEDSVPISEKEITRNLVANWLKKQRIGAGYVRVNALSTGLTIDDLNAVISANLDGIMLAKSECSLDIERVDWYISYLEKKHTLVDGSIDLIPLVENAKGIHNAYDIAISSPRVKRLCFGAIDYVTDLGIQITSNSNELFYARSYLVNSLRAAGLESPIDTVYPSIHDIDGLERDAGLARQLGFQGKLAIHPDQIATINKLFTPSEEEITFAYKVINAFEKAEEEGHAAITLDGGKFVDYPVVTHARHIIKIAEKCNLNKC